MTLTPDPAGFDLDAFFARLRAAAHTEARHGVGLVDPITAADQHARVGDGLPETLEEVVAGYGQRWFKLEPGLARLLGSIEFLEQPIRRQAALARPLGELAARMPVIVDESDDSLEAFVRARRAQLPHERRGPDDPGGAGAAAGPGAGVAAPDWGAMRKMPAPNLPPVAQSRTR